jgi:hypothetical protein
VAYDQLYRREMLVKKDLNWSVPNARLYSAEAFTGRAKRYRSAHIVSRRTIQQPTVPTTQKSPIVGWFQGAQQFQFGPPISQLPFGPASLLSKPAGQQQVC